MPEVRRTVSNAVRLDGDGRLVFWKALEAGLRLTLFCHKLTFFSDFLCQPMPGIDRSMIRSRQGHFR